MGLAQKGDGADLLRRSPEREAPSSEKGSAFKTAMGLIESPRADIGRLDVGGPLPEIPVKDPREAERGMKPEGPDSERSPGIYLPPDEAYIRSCYQRILELRSCQSKAAVVDGVNAILEEMADKAQKDDSSYTVMVNGALMLHWTRKEGDSTSYDEFMQVHVDAISVLAKAWMRDKVLGGKRIKILEASCGTGAVLEAFLDAVPPRLLGKLRITANDVASASIETTKKRMAKYSGKVRIEYTQNDLTQQIPNGKFDLILLSQTLPFLNDETALRAQRLGLGLPTSEMRHVTAKRKVLEALVNRLKPGRGELLVIDEHPMRLSKIPDEFDSIVEDMLFREIFRPISRGMLINDVMKRIDKARFRGHIESFIDRQHSMYLIASGSLKRPESDACVNPAAGKPQQDARKDEDVERIKKRIESIHGEIIGRLQGFEEADGTSYRSINSEKRLEIDKAYFEERIENRPGYWRTNGNYDLVVLEGLVHHVGQEGYRCLIEKLRKSHKIGPGSAILFIDEWPAPANSENPVGNGDARSLIFNAFDDHVFCASVRCGNKYGYLYVVRNL